MTHKQSTVMKALPTRYSLLNISRLLSIVSLPLSIVQSLIFIIYVVKLTKQEYYYHGITAEVCVHACLIYGIFFKKPAFLVPYIVLQLFAGIYYLFLAVDFGVQILQHCSSLFTCPVSQESDLDQKAEFMILASMTIPFQCAVAAVMVKTYKLLSGREEQTAPVHC